jgi:hypothetical protein
MHLFSKLSLLLHIIEYIDIFIADILLNRYSKSCVEGLPLRTALMDLVRVREATGSSLRSCVYAAYPSRCPGLEVSKLAYGSNNETSSLWDRLGHRAGFNGGSAHLPSVTPPPPRCAP